MFSGQNKRKGLAWGLIDHSTGNQVLQIKCCIISFVPFVM